MGAKRAAGPPLPPLRGRGVERSETERGKVILTEPVVNLDSLPWVACSLSCLERRFVVLEAPKPRKRRENPFRNHFHEDQRQ